MIKKLIPLFERLFSLLVVFLLLAATTIWSGKFLGKEWLSAPTSAVIVTEEAELPSVTKLRKMGLKDCELQPRDSISWTVISPQKETLGILISTKPMTDDIIGYAGTTPLYVYINNKGIVQRVVPDNNDETPSFFRKAARGILRQWDQLSVEDALEHPVDAVSGATYTSQSLIANMQVALSSYASTDLMHHKTPAIGWLRTLCLFGVFAIGIIVAWRYRGIKWLRLLVLALNVGITGFWCGQFLSLSILHGWIQNGVDFVLYLPTVVMLVIAIIMPYIGKRNHYCMWMCPYGSLQELAWALPFPKIKVKAKVFKWMGYVRMTILMLLLLSMWMGYGFSLLDYEPFSAFIVNTAAPAVMVLAGIFVVAGMFIPHPWCQCVCPVGALLNLAEEKK